MSGLVRSNISLPLSLWSSQLPAAAWLPINRTQRRARKKTPIKRLEASAQLASCLSYSSVLLKYVIWFCCWSFGCVLLSRCYLPWNSRKIGCSFSLFSVKNAKIVQLYSLTLILTLFSRADWSYKSEWHCRTVHCCEINLCSIKERTHTMDDNYVL